MEEAMQPRVVTPRLVVRNTFIDVEHGGGEGAMLRKCHSWSASGTSSQSQQSQESSSDSTHKHSLAAKHAKFALNCGDDGDGVDASVPREVGPAPVPAHFLFDSGPVPVEQLPQRPVHPFRDLRGMSSPQVHPHPIQSSTGMPPLQLAVTPFQRPQPPVNSFQRPSHSVSSTEETNDDQLEGFITALARSHSSEDGAEARHANRKCIPCVALIVTRACTRGDGCQYCHFSHEDNMNREQRPTKEMRIRCKQAIYSCIDGRSHDQQHTLDELQNLVATQAPFSRNYTVKLLRDSEWLETGDTSAFRTATSAAASSSSSRPAASSSTSQPAASTSLPRSSRSVSHVSGKGERQVGKQSKGPSTRDIPKGSSPRHQQPKGMSTAGKCMGAGEHSKGMPTGGKSMGTAQLPPGKHIGGKNMSTSERRHGMLTEGVSTSTGGKNSRQGPPLIIRL
eukprot:TRINITY_DN74969_c0_g1_i1.p1 TRINITY_DN74969_c0_g1~~TRINITY_DN74969_c0_g1_i1.p1  ORF type:complete len:450 (-),score=68.70 TRINITY_DN74969_c0_g1_i1:181-1530(-)